MADNEKTSEHVATIASRIMKMSKPAIMTNELWEDIKTLSASALTQTADKSKSSPLANNYTSIAKMLRGIGDRSRKPSVGIFAALAKQQKNKGI